MLGPLIEEQGLESESESVAVYQAERDYLFLLIRLMGRDDNTPTTE